MAKRLQKKERKKSNSVLVRILKAIYILLVIVAAAIVVAFIAFELLISPPDVDAQVTFTPPAVQQSPAGGGQTTLPDEEEPIEEVVYTRREGVYTCLIIGTDDGNGKADTIMLGCFDVNNKTASLISIPRDTLVSINGRDRKVNAAFGLGGLELVCETVSRTLAVPVDYYVAVDLRAFEEIVDEIGGVWFDVPINMHYEDPTQNLKIHLSKGRQLLDGKDAMGLVRFRSGYSNQDLGRVETQREFLTALVEQTITLSNVDKVTSLISILSKYVETDMPLDTMIYFATSAIGMDLDTALESDTLPADWISPYLEIRDEDALEMVNRLLPVYTEDITLKIMDIHHR